MAQKVSDFMARNSDENVQSTRVKGWLVRVLLAFYEGLPPQPKDKNVERSL